MTICQKALLQHGRFREIATAPNVHDELVVGSSKVYCNSVPRNDK